MRRTSFLAVAPPPRRKSGDGVRALPAPSPPSPDPVLAIAAEAFARAAEAERDLARLLDSMAEMLRGRS